MNFIIKFFAFVICFLINLVYVNLLEVDVQISENVEAGGNATLRCLFNCDVKEIVTLKWYRGNREFYRYMPSTYPSVSVFPFTVGGIDVDLRNSNATQVTLRNVSELLSGQFTCEVTAGQNLTTVSAYSTLHVYDHAVYAKPIIKYDVARQQISCSGIQVRHPVKRFSTVFYVDNDKISQSNVTYDNNSTVILNTQSLLDWNNGKSKVIRCEVDLPGTTPTSSDEVIVQTDTSDTIAVLPSTVFIFIGCILRNSFSLF
ncbi:uncharacterized protein LOC135840517 [Planococcus citri]|uniref:uncharacterized protein LOC135840517 n=1 Tax=Planococcus citri TaxID=170843 RepID=UPI0031F87C40